MMTKSNSARNSASLVFSLSEASKFGESSASEPEEIRNKLSFPTRFANDLIGASCNRALVRP